MCLAPTIVYSAQPLQWYLHYLAFNIDLLLRLSISTTLIDGAERELQVARERHLIILPMYSSESQLRVDSSSHLSVLVLEASAIQSTCCCLFRLSQSTNIS